MTHLNNITLSNCLHSQCKLKSKINCVHIILLDSAWQIQMQAETKPRHANSNKGHSKTIRRIM